MKKSNSRISSSKKQKIRQQLQQLQQLQLIHPQLQPTQTIVKEPTFQFFNNLLILIIMIIIMYVLYKIYISKK